MSAQENFNHCPQCHAFLQTAENAHRAFCKHCRFPLMLIANKYRLVEKLGEGSTASIYLAHHVGLIEDRERVIKVIKPETLSDETARLRFQREIQVTIALSRRNEHIVGIYDDFGEEPHLGHYYIMEYLQGRALQDMMFAGEPLGNWLTFRIFFQLCKAIGAAHRAGIVHRDLKPENILLVERDIEPYFLKLIDFGIAKPLRRKLDLVVTKGALGTPSYMSPEQCLNKPVDGRSDIYAMGALLFELLTGHQPFVDPNSEELTRESMLYLLEAHVKHKPRSMREAFPKLKIPEGLDKVVLRTLEKDPELRYQRVEDFWAALSAFAPPAYQQLELASQTALPALQMTTSSGGLIEAQFTSHGSLPGVELPRLSDERPGEDEDTDTSIPHVMPPHEAFEGTGYSVSSIGTLPPTSIDEGYLPVARSTESYTSLEAVQGVDDGDSVQARIDRFRSSSSAQLPAIGGSNEYPAAALAPDSPPAPTSPSGTLLAVATPREPRPPSRSPNSSREQGVQELIPGGSSDALPALQPFQKPADVQQSAAGEVPTALQGAAMPGALASFSPEQAASPSAEDMASSSTSKNTTQPAVLSAPSHSAASDSAVVEGVDASPEARGRTASSDAIEAAIEEVIASQPALPASTRPELDAVVEETPPAEPPPLRLTRKKSLRRKAMLASQETVEQPFLSPEQLAALAEQGREDDVDVDDVLPAPSESHPERPAPEVQALASTRSESPDAASEENPSSTPRGQASWFKAPK